MSGDRPRLESDAPFAATELGGRSSPVGKVHLYDLTTVGLNMNAEANTYLIQELFADTADNVPTSVTDLDDIVTLLSTKANCGGWVKNRHNPRNVLWYSNAEWSYTYGKGFWVSLNLAASEGGMVTSDIALDVIVDAPTTIDDVDFGGNYVTQKFGIHNTLGGNLGPGAGYSMPDYSPWSLAADKKMRPLPYWVTKVETTPALPAGIEVKAWSLDLTNSIQKRHSCSNTAGNHPGPRWVTIGTMDVMFSMTLLSMRTTGTVYLPARFSQVDLVLGDNNTHGQIQRLRFENVENSRQNTTISPTEIQHLTYDSGAFFNKPRLV
jgi:hypothetical protein